MFNSWSIRNRLLITFSVIALIGGTLQLVMAGRQLERATLENYRHQLETNALLVAATFAEPLEHYVEDPAGMQSTLKHIQSEVGHNYLLMDQDYDVLGNTTYDGFDSLGRAKETPELREAGQASIGNDIRPVDGEDILYVAAAIRFNRDVMGYVVLMESMSPAYVTVQQGWLELIGTSLPVFGLVIVASLWIARTISHPIQDLHNSALKMAQGVFETRSGLQSGDEVGELAKTFNYMAAEIEHLIKQQRSFISNAAHELRTPLMTIKLRAEALSDHSLPPLEQDTYLIEILEEIDHMAKLVSSLLALARLDEGKQSVIMTPIDTAAALHDIARRWRIEAEKAGIKLDIDIAPNLPELFISPNDLRIVLDNLLSNAVRYTPQGMISLRAAYAAETFTCVIKDTGIGFTEEQSLHLFERFYRSEEVRGQFNGNGLGLSIVKAILKRYRGDIRAQSQGIGQGAVFTVSFYIPLHSPR